MPSTPPSISERSPVARVAAATVHWAPIWVPAVLVLLISGRGLRPALERRSDLSQKSAMMSPLHQLSDSENTGLRLELEAWQDPMYRARYLKLRGR